MEKKPIGVLDSGVGGLTVLRELQIRLPQEDFLYLADQAHIPYGPRTMEEVRWFSFRIVEFLLAREAKLIVAACNTISAAALQPLRTAYPQIPFVGMEPAIKPAAEESRRGVIGVIATETTFQGELFASAVSRYGRNVEVIALTIPGLVERIEAGQTEGPELEAMLRARLQPLLDAGIDELVLGCTHYPFILPTLQKIFGPGVRIVDPAPAIARQVEKVLQERKLQSADGPGGVAAFSSGDVESFSRFIRHMLGGDCPVRSVKWAGKDDREVILVEEKKQTK